MMRKFGGILLILLLGATTLPAGEIVKYPDVEIDLAQKEVRIAASMSTELLWGEPVLEFILMRGAERGYETLFLTKADPAHLQLGLVMLGMQPQPLADEDDSAGRNPHPATSNPAGRKNAPSFVEIAVRWQTAAGEKTLPLEKFLFSRRAEKPALPIPLQLNGSYYYDDDTGKQTFAASATGIFIALLRNPTAILNLPYFEPSPYSDEPAGFSVKIDNLPAELLTTKTIDVADDNGVVRPVKRVVPKDAPVWLIFRPSNISPETARRDPYAR